MALRAEDALRREVRGLSGKQRTGWIFLCKQCGKEMWVMSYYLPERTGLCKSCTSARHCRENLSRLRFKRPFEGLYNTLCKRAKDRDIPISLTYEEFLCFTGVSDCHYCDSKVLWITHGRAAQNGGYHLDRKDSDLGYTKENSVVACGICNRIKNNHLSYEEMLCLRPVLQSIMAERRRQQ